MPNELLVANKHGKAVGYAANVPAEKSFGGDGGFGLLYAMTGMAGRNSDLVQSKMGAASAYQLIPAVNRSINLRADAVQSLDWKLIAGSSKGKKKPVILDDGDAAEAQTAFGQAMREAQKASRIALIEQIVYAHDLYGEVYVEPLGNRYRTTGLKWLNPLGMYVMVERGELVGFRWTPQNNDAQTYFFDADQIAYDKLFNPFDDFRGMGMVEVGIDTMNIARNLKRWLMSFFRNNARPGQVISPKPDSEFSPSNRNIIKTEVEMFAKGSDNAYSSLVLPIPMDIANFEQPDINNFYAINAPLQSEIYTIFGVPEALAGDQGKTRYKQGGDIMQAFYTNTIIPLSRWVEDYMNFQVLPFFNLGDATFEFDLSEFDTASADDKLRADIATEKFEATLITRDEARIYAGEAPVGGDLGSAYYVPPAPVPPPGSAPITVSTPKPEVVPGGEAAKPQLPTGAKPPVPASAVPKPPSPTGQEKAVHSRSKCMMCDDPPTKDVKWAEGMARAWFCDKHFAEWTQEHPGEADSVHDVTKGEVPAEFSKGITYITPKQADARDEIAAWERKASKGNAQKAFVCEKTAKHVEAFIRAELEAIGAGAEKALVRAVFEDARYTAGDWNAIKSTDSIADSFADEVAGLVGDANNDDASRQAFAGGMRSALRRSGLQAYRAGMNAGGSNPESLSKSDLDTFRDWQSKQSDYVSNIGTALYKDGDTPDPDDKGALWTRKSLGDIYWKGLHSAAPDMQMTWNLGATDKSCPTCLANDQQTKTVADWMSQGMPQSDELDCKGFECLCFGTDADGNVLGIS